MSDVIVYFDFETYLAQWFVNDHGGTLPVKLRRGCPDSNLLYMLLSKRPTGGRKDEPREGAVPVILPYYSSKDIHYCNWLSEEARARFYKHVRTRFLVELWDDLHKCGYIGMQKQMLIYDWMKQHGIEETETNYFAVQKIYQRLRDSERKRQAKKKLKEC